MLGHGLPIYSSLIVYNLLKHKPLLLHLLIHEVRPQSQLDAACNIRARVQQVPVLEDEHPAYLGVNVKRALHVVRMKCRRSAFELVARCRLVEIQMQGVEGDFFAVRGHVAAVAVC